VCQYGRTFDYFPVTYACTQDQVLKPVSFFSPAFAEDELTIIHTYTFQNNDSSKNSQTDNHKSNDRKGNGNAHHNWPLRVRCHDEWPENSKECQDD
jgi:hypothetical protein